MAFKRLDPEDFVVSSDSVTSTVWSNNSPSLNTFHSSSVQKEGASGPFYISIYQTASVENTAEIQYQIAYGNKNGGGGIDYDGAVPNVSATSTIYGQYRALVLEDENSQFIWGSEFSGSDDNDFYVLSLERARYKQTLLPGSTNIVLSSSGDMAALHLTDNSNMVSLPDYYGTTRVYQLISGSNGSSYDGGTGYTTNSGSYGWFLPDISTYLLNPYALRSQTQGINLVTNTDNNSNSQNPASLYTVFSSSGAVARDSGNQSISNVFQLNSQETLTSDFVFVRTRNTEFNYSENPTFISGSTGEVLYTYFINNPTVFPTTIGLYNDSNELLAVAKLSKPLQKDFTKEALVRVKLDF